MAQTDGAKAEALASTFFPPPPNTSSVPTAYDYDAPIGLFRKFTREDLVKVISGLHLYKATGPDGIPNVVYARCQDVLVPRLLPIFNAAVIMGFYYDPWRLFTTVVLRKPGKPDYAIPKAYRPIALVDTAAKILSALVTEQTLRLLESNNLLPEMAFGG
ncbi:hypothetical protein CONPUDRAFT_59013, partial [Coniophora puteana RWD-64-598 SS2]